MTRRAAIGLLASATGIIAGEWITGGGSARAACGSIPSTADPAVLTIVYAVAMELGATERVLLAGFETGWVESHMNNLNCGDSDSLGVFQQRPSQGWGTPAQVMDVRFASTSFFTRAIPLAAAHPSWTAGQIAQGVQRSAFPDRYDAARPTAEALIAQARAGAARQVWEAASNNGWRALPVGDSAGPVTASAVAAIDLQGTKILYTVRGGNVYEAASNNGWRNLWTGVSGASGSAVAALNVGGVKHIYTLIGGTVHEAASNNGWRNLSTGISGAGAGSLAAITVGGVKYIYTIVGGVVHEAHSANGWRNLSTGIPATAVAAIAAGDIKIIYSVSGGNVYEAASNAGWRNLWTGIAGVSGSTLSAVYLGGVKYIYSVVSGLVHEAHSANGWRNLNSGVPGSAVSAIASSGIKVLYTI